MLAKTEELVDELNLVLAEKDKLDEGLGLLLPIWVEEDGGLVFDRTLELNGDELDDELGGGLGILLEAADREVGFTTVELGNDEPELVLPDVDEEAVGTLDAVDVLRPVLREDEKLEVDPRLLDTDPPL